MENILQSIYVPLEHNKGLSTFVLDYTTAKNWYEWYYKSTSYIDFGAWWDKFGFLLKKKDVSHQIGCLRKYHF